MLTFLPSILNFQQRFEITYFLPLDLRLKCHHFGHKTPKGFSGLISFEPFWKGASVLFFL